MNHPTTDKVYYTKEIDKTKTGAITFKDEKSGSTVSLQSSEVKQISKEEFQAGLYAAAAPVKVTPAPAPAQAPVAAPAPAAAAPVEAPRRSRPLRSSTRPETAKERHVSLLRYPQIHVGTRPVRPVGPRMSLFPFGVSPTGTTLLFL